MGIITLRPNETYFNTGWEQSEEGGPPHYLIKDHSDDTYVYYEHSGGSTWGNVLEVSPEQLTGMPAGARIRQVRMQEKTRGGSDMNAPEVRHRSRIGASSTYLAYNRIHEPDFNWYTRGGTWWSSRPGGGEWQQSDFDGSANGLRQRWEVRGADPQKGSVTLWMSRVYFVIEYNERPVVSNIQPSGIVDDTSAPPISWDYDDAEGDPQEAFQVRISVDNGTAFEEVHDSGKVYSGSQQYIPPPLESGSYMVEVRAFQSWHHGDFASAWGSQTFTIDVAPAPVPVLTLTQEPNEGRIKIDIAEPEPPNDPTAADWQVQGRQSGANVSWVNVRGAEFVEAISAEATIYDYEAWPNRLMEYRARSRIYDPNTGDAVVSDWSSPVSETLEVEHWWLKDPFVPEMNTRLRRVDGTQVGRRDTRATTFYGLGRRDAIVTAGLTTDKQFTHRFITTNEAERAALEAFALANRDMLLVSPRGKQWYVRLVGDVRDDEDILNEPGDYNTFTFPLAVVRRPLDEVGMVEDQ